MPGVWLGSKCRSTAPVPEYWNKGSHGHFSVEGGAHGEWVECEPITGVLEQSPHWGPGAEPLVRRSGAKPSEAESFLALGRATDRANLYTLQYFQQSITTLWILFGGREFPTGDGGGDRWRWHCRSSVKVGLLLIAVGVVRSLTSSSWLTLNVLWCMIHIWYITGSHLLLCLYRQDWTVHTTTRARENHQTGLPWVECRDSLMKLHIEN